MALNVTATGALGDGYVQAFPTGGATAAGRLVEHQRRRRPDRGQPRDGARRRGRHHHALLLGRHLPAGRRGRLVQPTPATPPMKRPVRGRRGPTRLLDTRSGARPGVEAAVDDLRARHLRPPRRRRGRPRRQPHRHRRRGPGLRAGAAHRVGHRGRIVHPEPRARRPGAGQRRGGHPRGQRRLRRLHPGRGPPPLRRRGLVHQRPAATAEGEPDPTTTTTLAPRRHHRGDHPATTVPSTTPSDLASTDRRTGLPADVGPHDRTSLTAKGDGSIAVTGHGAQHRQRPVSTVDESPCRGAPRAQPGFATPLGVTGISITRQPGAPAAANGCSMAVRTGRSRSSPADGHLAAAVLVLTTTSRRRRPSPCACPA